MKVLLADDHILFIEGMRSILNSMFSDVEFECVSNGHQALEKLLAESYDIALVDLRLPGIDGFSLLEKLSESLCLTPIIMVTASEDPWDMEKAIELVGEHANAEGDAEQAMPHLIKLIQAGALMKK